MTGEPAGIKNISLSAVSPSKSNPRQSIDPVALDGLVESIKAVGLQNPILLRPDADGYEIVAGHRRYAAFEELGEEEIPAIVREMTDDECREVQLVDNLQREDLDLLEECAAYVKLLEWLPGVPGVALRVGKSVAHVTRVVQLKNLTQDSRAALLQKLISFDHALLLAKLAEAEQDKALRWALFGPFCKAKDTTPNLIARASKEAHKGGVYGYYEPKSVLELKRFIERDIRLELKRAPWGLDDADLLPSAGACTVCPRNTAANNALFGDLAIEEAVCMDSECFDAKREQFVRIQMEAVRLAGAGAVQISWKSSSSAPRLAKNTGRDFAAGLKEGQPKPGQVFKRGQWVEAKKDSCEHVVTGVAVDYDELGILSGPSYRSDAQENRPGARKLVCVAAKCKVHPKDWEKPKSQRNGAYDERAEDAKRRKMAEACKAESRLRVELANAALDKVAKLPDALIREAFDWMAPWDFRKRAPRWAKALKSSPVSGREFTEAAAAVWLWHHGLGVNESGFYGPEQDRKEFQTALKQLGYDASRAWKKQSSNSEGKEVAEKRQSSRTGASAKPRPPAKKATPKKSSAKKSTIPNPQKKSAAKKPLHAKKSAKKGARK